MGINCNFVQLSAFSEEFFQPFSLLLKIRNFKFPRHFDTQIFAKLSFSEFSFKIRKRVFTTFSSFAFFKVNKLKMILANQHLFVQIQQ